jgi:hypothetical protein
MLHDKFAHVFASFGIRQFDPTYHPTFDIVGWYIGSKNTKQKSLSSDISQHRQ